MLRPLIDRIEVINVPAYLPSEKLNIAKSYIKPDLDKEYAFKLPQIEEHAEAKPQEYVNVTDAAIMQIINKYCGHEAGVRNLKKNLDRVYRKIVAKLEN